MRREIAFLIQSAERLASLPQVYQRVNAAVEDPASSLDDIGAIILEDQTLSLRLLKIANSSLYNFPQPVDTITRALTVVGTRQLRDLLMATSVMQMFNGQSSELLRMEAFWQHAMACGLTARIIASYRREPNVETFYVGGLLHDIGRLLMFMFRPQEAGQLLRRAQAENLPLLALERDELEYDHADVGWALLQQWELPDRLSIPVAWHHDPEGADHHQLEAAVIHLSDIITIAMGLGSSGERYVPPLDPLAWQRVGLSANLLPAIVTQVESQWHEAIRLFMEAP